MALKILVFDSEASAQAALAVIDQLALGWFQQIGADVRLDSDGVAFVVPRNQKTGSPNENGVLTYSWQPGGPRQLTDGRWWLFSLTGQRDDWSNWLSAAQELAPGVSFGEEIDMPDED
jgi:hypothetical protein